MVPGKVGSHPISGTYLDRWWVILRAFLELDASLALRFVTTMMSCESLHTRVRSMRRVYSVTERVVTRHTSTLLWSVESNVAGNKRTCPWYIHQRRTPAPRRMDQGEMGPLDVDMFQRVVTHPQRRKHHIRIHSVAQVLSRSLSFKALVSTVERIHESLLGPCR